MAQYRPPPTTTELVVWCFKGEGTLLKFWASTLAAIETVHKLELHLRQLEEQFESTSSFIRSNQIPRQCAVKSRSMRSQWCRARVLTILSQSDVLVRLLDYGIEEPISVADVREIDDSLICVPPQATECILADVMPLYGNKWPPEAVNFCNQLVNFPITGIVVSEYLSVPIIRIAKKGEKEPFVQRLINQNLARIKEEQPSHSPEPQAYKLNVLVQNTHHLVKISYIDSDKFYVQLVAAESELRNLMDSIKLFTSTETLSLLSAPVTNTPCLALFEKPNVYYRTLIIQILGSKCMVFYVDYGLTSIKEFHELRVIPPRFLGLNAQAICCRLKDVDSTVCGDYLGSLKSFHLDMYVMGQVTEAYIVQLKKRGGDEVHAPIPNKVLAYQNLHPKVGMSYEVCVCCTNDVSDFYCQFGDSKKQLDEIQEIINSPNYDSGEVTIADCLPNLPIVVKFSEDNVWYRAQIIKINHEHDIEVFFVDYGNFDNASTRDIRRISLDLLAIPTQAFKCSLFDVESPADSAQKDEMFETFEEFTVSRTLTAEIKAHTDMTYSVVLKDGHSPVSINAKLESKFASIGFVPVSSKEMLFITSFTSPSSFFGQFEKLSSEDLEGMQEEINNFYSNSRRANFKPQVGAFVCARYHVDGQFYRAQVENSAEDKCTVFFVDYGNRESLLLQDIHPLNSQFLKLPRFGIDCSLEKFPPAVPVEKLSGLMLENTIQASMIKNQNNKWLIALTEDFTSNVAILELLRQHEAVVPRSIHGTGLRGYQETTNSYNLNAQSKPDSSSLNGSGFGMSISQSGEPIPEKKEYSEIVLPKNAYRNVYVSHVENPSEFYCQIEEFSPKLQSLMKDIQSTYSKLNHNELNISQATVNLPCCALFVEDGSWYRAQIKQVNSNNYKVLYIDYGNSDTVPVSKIKSLKPNFFDLPPQAIKCKSFNCSPKGSTWSEEEINMFMNMSLDKSFVAQFVENERGSYAVNLVNIGKLQEDVLVKEFVSKGHGRLDDSSKTIVLNSQAASSNLTFKPPEVALGSAQAVVVTYGYNLGKVYCQLKSSEAEFKKMMLSLQKYCQVVTDNSATIDKPRPGMICVAQFALDLVWYRGEIKKVEKNSITVCYVDYGNTELVDKKKVRYIQQDFTVLPIQGIKCIINGIKTPEKAAPANQNISRYFDGDAQCTFLSKKDDNYVVELIINGKNIAQVLISDKLVVADGLVVQSVKSAAPHQALPKRSSLAQGQLLSVVVSFVESPFKFWCQLAEETETLDQLMAVIGTHYQDSNIQPANPNDLKVGAYFMAKYSEDGAWYRANIKSPSSAGSYEVFFVDYGNSEVVASSDIANIDPEFVKHPPLCFESRLLGSPPTCDPKVTAKFQGIVDQAEEITAKVEQATDIVIVTLLYDVDDEEVNVGAVLFGEEMLSAAPIATVVKFMPREVPLGLHDGYGTIVNSPHEFFIQLAGIEDDLSELSTQLSEVAESSTDFLTSPTLGCACAAKFDEDNNWYRAEIINLQDTTADVLFVDYGNTSTVPKNSLKTLDSNMLKTPPYALKCKLNGVIPPSGEQWSEASINAFQEMVTDVQLGITFISKDIPAIVNISKDEKDVAQSLVDTELAVVDSSPEAEYADDPLAAIEDHLHSLPFDQTYPRRKINATKLPVKISYVDSSDKFYIMPLELSTELDTVMKTLELLYGSDGESFEKTPAQLEDPRTAQPCVAKYSEDELWYRALITEVEGENIYVSFVDYGNSEVTTLTNLRPLTPELLKIPPIAVECKLSGIQAVKGKEQEITAKFENYYIEEIELEMEVLKPGEPHTVKLTHDGESLAEILCKDGLTTEVITELEADVEQLVEKLSQDLKIVNVIQTRPTPATDEISISVKHCEIEDSSVVIYGVLVDLEEQLEAFQEKLQALYNGREKSLEKISIMDFYAAKYSEDESWYRAQVLTSTDGEIKVRFVDYGNCDTVDINNVHELPQDLMSEPQFSTKFSLGGVTIGDDQEDCVQGKLDQHLYEEPVLAKLCKHSHQTPGICLTSLVCGESNLVDTFLDEQNMVQVLMAPCKLQAKFKASVINIVDELFYLLPVQFKKNHDELLSCMLESCCDTEKVDKINPCYVYAAKIEDRISRVSIVTHSDNSVVVNALDLGLQIDVDPSSLISLPKPFLHKPLYLIPCLIQNLENAPDKIKNKDIEQGSGIVYQCEMKELFASKYPLKINIFEECVDKISEENSLQDASNVEDSSNAQDLTSDINTLKEAENSDKDLNSNEGTSSYVDKEGQCIIPVNDVSMTDEVIDNSSVESETKIDIGQTEEHTEQEPAKPILAAQSDDAMAESTIHDSVEVEMLDEIEGQTEEQTELKATESRLEVDYVEEANEESKYTDAIDKADDVGSDLDEDCIEDVLDKVLEKAESQVQDLKTPQTGEIKNEFVTHDNSSVIEDSEKWAILDEEMQNDLNSLNEAESRVKDVQVLQTEVENNGTVLYNTSGNKDLGNEDFSDEEMLNELNSLKEEEDNHHQVQSVENNLDDNSDKDKVLTVHETLTDTLKDEEDEFFSDAEIENLSAGDISSSNLEELEKKAGILHSVGEPNIFCESSDNALAEPEHVNRSHAQDNHPNQSSISEAMHNEEHTNTGTSLINPKQLNVDENEDLVTDNANTDEQPSTVSENNTRQEQEDSNTYLENDNTNENYNVEEMEIEDSTDLESASHKPNLTTELNISHRQISGRVSVHLLDTKVSNGSIIMAVLPDDIYDEFLKMEETFQGIYSAETKPISSDVQESSLYAVHFEGSWCRCKVLNIHNVTVSVLLIDHGKITSVDAKQMKDLEDEHKVLPPYAIWCTLISLYCPDETLEKTVALLDEICNVTREANKCVLIEVLEKEEPYSIQLLFDDIDFLHRLLKNNWVIQRLKTLHLPEGDHIAKVSHFEYSSGKLSIHVNILNTLGAFQYLRDLMKRSYSDDNEGIPILESGVYAIQHENEWYRAKAVSSNNELLMQLVDTGKTLSIEGKTAFPLRPEHCIPPAYAFECHVTDASDLPEDAVDSLRRLLLENEFAVRAEGDASCVSHVVLADREVISMIKNLVLESCSTPKE